MTRQANRLQDGLIVENGNITLSTSSDIVRNGVSVLGGGSALANYEEDSTTYSTLGVGNQLEYGGYVWVNSDGGVGMFGGTTVRAIADDIGNNFYISYSDEGLANGIPDSGNSYHWKFNGNDNTLEMPSGGAFRPDGSTTTNQVLKIVPTNNERGDHIHLVSGNIGITSIFLGDDTQYIRTQADGAMVIGTADAYPDEVNTNSNRWIFDASGVLRLPDGTNLYGEEGLLKFDVVGGFEFNSYGDGGGGGLQSWVFGTDGSTTFPNDTILGTGSDPNVYIETLANGSTSTWTFGTDGDLTLPGQLLFPEGTTFYNNGISVSSGTQYATGVEGNTAGINQYWFADGTMPTRKWAAVRVNSPENASTGSVVVSTGAFNGRNNWIFAHDGSTVLPENTLKGYCFTATNAVGNYIPQAAQFMYTDNPILQSIATIGGAWYIKGPGLVGWKPITAVQDNSGVALIVRIGSGGGPMLDGSEFHSGGYQPNSPDLVYTISQYLELDVKAADKTWTFNQAGSLTFPDATVQTMAYAPQSAPSSSLGKPGDQAGMVAYSTDYFYYCTGSYNNGSSYTQYPAETRIGDANGVDTAYLIPNSYQLPSVGWIIYYNGQTAVINQVNNGGNPGYYTVFVDTALFIPQNASLNYGPAPTTHIWQRIAKDATTW